MKNVFKIFISDVRNILKNKIALIIVCGLLILPSLYAWFNIYASWDPYGNTGGINVVICNNDLGGKIESKNINIGKDIVSSLKENDTLGWTFINEADEAIEVVRKGEAYATIIIPKDFSEKMSTVISDNPMKPSLEYYVNEKINAISPKITDKGASVIQNKISTTFVESVTQQVFSMLHEVGIDVKDNAPLFSAYDESLNNLIKDIPIAIKRLNANAETITDGSELISLSAEDMTLFNNVFNDLISFSTDFKKDLDKLNYNTKDVSRELVETLNLTKVSLKDLDSNTMKLKEKVILEKPDFAETLNESSNNLKKLGKDMNSVKESLNEFNEDISPELNSLYDLTEEQLIDLEHLLNKMAYSDLHGDNVHEVAKSIHELNSKIESNLLKLDYGVQNAIEPINTKYIYLDNISKNLSKLFEELNSKDQTTDKANNICDDILININELRNGINNEKSLLLRTLNSIEKDLINIKSNKSIDTSIADLRLQQKKLTVYTKQYSILKTLLENTHGRVEPTLSFIKSMDNTTSNIDKDVNSFIDSFHYYSESSSNDIRKARKSLRKINLLLNRESNYLTPLIKEVSDISLARLEDMSVLLNDVSNNIENNNRLENSLSHMHNLNTNMISNIDNLIIKINTDLTSTVKRYLSSASNFSGDINELLVSITEKSKLIEDFLKKLSHNGKIAAKDMIEIGKKLPKIRQNLILVNNKTDEFSKKLNIDKFINRVKNNKGIVADFMASPVELSAHPLYSTKNYGSAMTPFYTTLALWVGVLVLSSLLTTESKNVNFKPTPLQNHLGKFPLFALLAIIQGLIVSLGDILLLKVSVSQPVLFINLSMFLSLVFCTIIYTLISLFGNVGKAMGVILLVLQVAGSGGTFPIQMTPPFFQKLYAWLPFTYGIGALREAVAGVYYPSLRSDIITLIIYLVVFLVIGILFISRTHKYMEKISHKLEESGITE
ncbi:YhgE/Pip family protein [Dethiothermospora halolimnae]|uniref:YhgE/Pip family protein n=1 Tax=Dethiothermospora halolimnae TaxID=3114390 RepID=UPI003CCC3631